MTFQFDYAGAKKEGYSDEEIFGFLKENVPAFDFDGALKEGYSQAEINSFLGGQEQKQMPKERSLGEKAARTAGQYALGMAESAFLPYELSVAPLAQKESQFVAYRENLMDDIERLQLQKQAGVFDEADQKLLDNLLDQYKNPKKSDQFIQTANIGIRDFAEKATGEDLSPEGIAEHAANWTGFMKNPTKIPKLTPKEFVKAIAPTGTDVMRGLGAGTALQIAEDEEFGPIGQMAATIIGDLTGAGLAKGAKAITAFGKNPKKAMADAVASFTKKDQLELQKEIIKNFNEAGIQADVGSLTDSNFMRMLQTKLAQSGFTGEPLERFQKQMTSQIVNEYKALANTLGEYKNATARDTGEVVTNVLKSIRNEDQKIVRTLYEDFKEATKTKNFVKSNRLASTIDKTLSDLKPGAYKSTQQREVIGILNTLKQDLVDSEGKLLQANVKDLLNNKIALNQAIDYEVQGGVKQLLKNVVGEIDRAIISVGKDNPRAARLYIDANKKAAEHAKTFRNKTIDKIFRMQEEDPSKVLDLMNTIQGQKNLEKALSKTAQGRKVFNDLKRYKLDQVIGNNLVDGTTQQIKFQSFPKLLEKKSNREIVKGLLPPQGFKRLERLQRNAAGLAESINKFYNASKTFSAGADAALVSAGLKAFGGLLYGNPWPLIKYGAGIQGARKLSQTLTDPEFLKLVEEAIMKSKKGSPKTIFDSFMKLKPYLQKALQESKDKNQEENRIENEII